MLRAIGHRNRAARGASAPPARASAAPPVLTPATVNACSGRSAIARSCRCSPAARSRRCRRARSRRRRGRSPGLPLSAKQRERFEKETHSRLNQALTAFTDAAKSHAEALKAKAKMDAEIAAVALDIFFGLSAPVFAGLVMARGGRLKLAAEKIASALSLGRMRPRRRSS